MYGWMGRRLRIDLSRATFDIETLSLDYCRHWIGGRGLNADVIYREALPGLSAFGAENPICFAAGALTGTLAPASGLAFVGACAPQAWSLMGPNVTGIGAGAVTGGLGPMIKYAGYDQIVVTGRAAAPMYVLVNGQTVEFREASHLWGLGTRMAAIRILEELRRPEVGLALIGPAGEHRVRIAGVVGTGHMTAECGGAGAVMGSKCLKALAVLGNKPVAIAEPKGFMRSCWEARDRFQQVCLSAEQRDPRNRSSSQGPRQGQVLFRKNACWSCPAGCEAVATLKEGPFAGFQGVGPAPHMVLGDAAGDVFENFSALPVIYDALRDWGLDATSAAMAVSWIWLAHENGIVTDRDLDCSLADRRDPRTHLELVRRIGFRQGLGDALADGVNLRACAASRGLPVQDLLACSPKPGDCDKNGQRLFNEAIRARCAADVAGFCSHDVADVRRSEVLGERLVQLLGQCTGIDFDQEEINLAAERTLSLQRAVWLRQGSARQDDSKLMRHWSTPFFVRNLPPLAEYTDPDETVQQLYYLTKGWDSEGFITRQKASELAVTQIVSDIERGRQAYQEWLAQRDRVGADR